MMKKNVIFILLVTMCIIMTPTLTGCKSKVHPSSDSISIFLDTTIMHKLTQHQLQVIMDKDSLFGDFYSIIRSNTKSVDDVQKVKWLKVKYNKAYKYYKIGMDSAYWERARKKWKVEWQKEYGEINAALEIFNKANITINFKCASTLVFNTISYSVSSNIACQAYVKMFFHPNGMNQGVNCDCWMTLGKGTGLYCDYIDYNLAHWFVTYTNYQGGASVDYHVQTIIYKGKTYDVETALESNAPSLEEYENERLKVSLYNLNPELFSLLSGIH